MIRLCNSSGSDDGLQRGSVVAVAAIDGEIIDGGPDDG